MDGLPDPSMSAEAYGTLLAAELERATVEDDPLLAVCIDLSKCYDTVHLELLEFLLAGSGLAAEIWRPHDGHGTGTQACQGDAGGWRLEVAHLWHAARLSRGHLRDGPAS